MNTPAYVVEMSIDKVFGDEIGLPILFTIHDHDEDDPFHYKYTIIEGAGHFVDNAKNVLLPNKTYCGEQDVDADLMVTEGYMEYALFWQGCGKRTKILFSFLGKFEQIVQLIATIEDVGVKVEYLIPDERVFDLDGPLPAVIS